MSITSRTNRWTSRLVIALQLVTWSAVSIVLLQKGVSSLQRRKLEVSQVTEADPSIGDSSIESGSVSTSRESAETGQSVDEIAKVIIRFNSESAEQKHRNSSGLSVIKSELGDEFEIVSEERRATLSPPNTLEISTTDRETLGSSRTRNRLSQVSERDSNDRSRIQRIIRDKIVDHGISGNIRAEENIASSEESVSQSASREEGNPRHAKDKDIDLTKSVSRFTSSSVGEKADDRAPASDSLWRKDGAQFSGRVSASGAAMAVVMVVVGTIMLLLGPTVILLRLLDERRRARKLQNELSDDSAWRDPPPTYEQVVLMNEEAPRYSTLVLSGRLGDDIHLSPFSSRLSPSPSPSPSPSLSPSPSPLPHFSPTYDSSLDLSASKSYSHR